MWSNHGRGIRILEVEMRNLEISILELEHELGTVGVEVVHKGEEVSVAGDEGDHVVQSLGSRTGRGKFV